MPGEFPEDCALPTAGRESNSRTASGACAASARVARDSGNGASRGTARRPLPLYPKSAGPAGLIAVIVPAMAVTRGDRDPRAHEFSVQLRAFDAAKSGAKTGVASLIALSSALLRKSVRGGLVVVGEVTLGGTIEPVHNAVT